MTQTAYTVNDSTTAVFHMTATDPTAASIQKILASGDYEEIKNVPIFDEHDEFGPDGKLLRRFGRKELQEIADSCNSRLAKTGDLAPFGPGHTVDDIFNPKNGTLVYKAKETDQPPIWGFVGKYQVGRFGPENKLSVLCSLYAKKKHRADIDEYPRRSIELWIKDKVVDWVALLKRTPERDLGLLTCSKDANGKVRKYERDPVYYDALKHRHLLSAMSKTGKLRYAMGENMGPVEPPDAEAPDQEFEEKVMRCIKNRYPQLDDIMQKYSAGAAASGTNTAIPGAETPPAMPPGAPPAGGPLGDDEKLRMQKAQSDIQMTRYQKENEELKARLDALEKQAAESLQVSRYAKRERDATQELAQGRQFDLVEHMDYCKDLDDDKYQSYMKIFRKTCAKDPTGSMIRIHDTPIEGGERPEVMDERLLDEVLSYQKQNGIEDFEEAVVKYKKSRTA